MGMKMSRPRRIRRSLPAHSARNFSLPLAVLPEQPEVRVDNLLVPSQVKAGAPYHVEAVVFSTFETTASLELFRAGAFVGHQEMVLQPGKNRFTFLQSTAEKVPGLPTDRE